MSWKMILIKKNPRDKRAFIRGRGLGGGSLAKAPGRRIVIII